MPGFRRSRGSAQDRWFCTSRVISNLYYNVMSLKLKPDPMALQFTASHPGEGTSLVASQFAKFATGLAYGSVLLIDCTSAGRADGRVPVASGSAAAVATGFGVSSAQRPESPPSLVGA